MLGLRITCLNDPLGNHVKSDTLFLNLYDYWTESHNPQKCYRFGWYPSLIWRLERNIRKKWAKHLSNVNIIFEKYKQGEEFFNPRPFHENVDSEKYFELLIDWKSKNEQYHLINKQYLRRP